MILFLFFLLTVISTASSNKLDELKAFYSAECSKLVEYADAVSLSQQYVLTWLPGWVFEADPLWLSRVGLFKSDISSLGVCSGQVQLTWFGFGEESHAQQNSRLVLHMIRTDLEMLEIQLEQRRLEKLAVLLTGLVAAIPLIAQMISNCLGARRQQKIVKEIAQLREEIKPKKNLMEEWMKHHEKLLGIQDEEEKMEEAWRTSKGRENVQ